MLYVQQFQNNRLDYLKHHQHLRSSVDQKFSLCSVQYIDKFPKLSRREIPNVDYPRDQTLFFLSKKTLTEMKLTNENQQQTGIIQKNKTSMTTSTKGSVRDDEKQILNENSPSRWYHQVSRNVNGLAKLTAKGNSFPTSFSLPMGILPEVDQPTTAPLILDENIRQTITARIKSNTPSRLLNPHVVDLSDNLTDSSLFQFKSITFENDNQFSQQSHIDPNSHENFLDSSVVMNSTDAITTTTIDNPDEPKIFHRNSQCKINAFQHIANLGSWQRNSKHREIESSEKSKEIEHEEDLSLKKICDYKSPFSEEYDQAIYLQAQIQTNNNINELNLREFYRDVKTQFESGTNTKPVLKNVLNYQANTIKWEQRRRQNLNIYNRLIKNPSFDNNILSINGNLPPNITDLKRELRCNECKRISCLGNCAPGQEYHQYKRLIPLSSLPTTREQIRCKLNLRTQRSSIDIRPRSQQQIIRTEQTTLNPLVVVPLFEDDAETKRPQKKLTHGLFPGKSFRAQRGETLNLISSNKILS